MWSNRRRDHDMNPEAAPVTAKRPRRYVMTTGGVLFVLAAGSFSLTLLGIAADWIGWSGLFLAPVAITIMTLGMTVPGDPSLPPPHPLQVLNNCQ